MKAYCKRSLPKRCAAGLVKLNIKHKGFRIIGIIEIKVALLRSVNNNAIFPNIFR